MPMEWRRDRDQDIIPVHWWLRRAAKAFRRHGRYFDTLDLNARLG
jgi:hypothetical protein